MNSILKGVVALADVRSDDINFNFVITKQLESLGAQSAKRFTSKLTHLVFKDGNPSTYERAQRENLQIVGVSWLNACAKAGSRVPESDYPPALSRKWRELADSPFRNRFRRCVNLHSGDEDIEQTLLRTAERRKRKEAKAAALAEKSPLVMQTTSLFSAARAADSTSTPSLSAAKLAKSPVLSKHRHRRCALASASKLTLTVGSNDADACVERPCATSTKKRVRFALHDASNADPSNDNRGKPPPRTVIRRNGDISKWLTGTSRRLFDAESAKPAPVSSASCDAASLKSTEVSDLVIVATSLRREDQSLLEEAAGKMQRVQLEQTVTARTSHLICGDSLRHTFNFLKALAFNARWRYHNNSNQDPQLANSAATSDCFRNGSNNRTLESDDSDVIIEENRNYRKIHIVTRDWLVQSSRVGRWLSERDFEFPEFGEVVAACADVDAEAEAAVEGGQARRRSAPLSRFGSIAIRSGSMPVEHLAQLVQILGGRLVHDEAAADLLIVRLNCAVCKGEQGQNSGDLPEKLTVRDDWIVESVMAGAVLRVARFLVACRHEDANRRVSIIDLD